MICNFNQEHLPYRIVVCVKVPETVNILQYFNYRLTSITIYKLKGWRKVASGKLCRLCQHSFRSTTKLDGTKSMPVQNVPRLSIVVWQRTKAILSLLFPNFTLFFITFLFQHFCDLESPVCFSYCQEVFCLEEWFLFDHNLLISVCEISEVLTSLQFVKIKSTELSNSLLYL